jgi:hypothetical protein
MRTLRRFSADEFLDELLGRKLFFPLKARSGLNFADLKLLLFATAGEKTVVPNLCEPCWQHMHQKSPDKFIGSQRHDFPAAVVTVITPFESNSTVINFENTVA